MKCIKIHLKRTNFFWMVNLAMSIFEFLTNFLIFWQPWHPWLCIRSVCWKWNLKQIEAIPPSVEQRWNNARTTLERSWNEAGTILERLWNDSGMNLEWLWNNSGTTLERLWNSSRTTLELFWNDSLMTLEWLWNNSGTTSEQSWTQNLYLYQRSIEHRVKYEGRGDFFCWFTLPANCRQC